MCSKNGQLPPRSGICSSEETVCLSCVARVHQQGPLTRRRMRLHRPEIPTSQAAVTTISKAVLQTLINQDLCRQSRIRVVVKFSPHVMLTCDMFFIMTQFMCSHSMFLLQCVGRDMFPCNLHRLYQTLDKEFQIASHPVCHNAPLHYGTCCCYVRVSDHSSSTRYRREYANLSAKTIIIKRRFIAPTTTKMTLATMAKGLPHSPTASIILLIDM